MLCIQNDIKDPYFNLATEEYILKNFKENCFILWRSYPSIIIGKHQNTLAEINYDYVKKNNINVVRRLSGGGTVFHDLGNLNFSFIQNVGNDENLVDFRRYTKPIIDVLNDLGVDAKFEGRNDIMINGKKVSGNAEHVYKKRVLHHGTLLFSSQIKDLSQALKVNPLIYTDKGVKSVRSRVTNISDYLKEKISVLDFRERIFNHIVSTRENVEFYSLTQDDMNKINDLLENKYKTWKWNFGYSPKYQFEKTTKLSKGNVEINMSVEKGLILDLNINSNVIDAQIANLLTKHLIGIEHHELVIRETLQKLLKKENSIQISIQEIIQFMF